MKQLNTVASTSSSSRYRAHLYSVQRYLYIDSISLIKTRAKQKHAQVCKVKVNFEHGRMCYAYIRGRGSVGEGGERQLHVAHTRNRTCYFIRRRHRPVQQQQQLQGDYHRQNLEFLHVDVDSLSSLFLCLSVAL